MVKSPSNLRDQQSTRILLDISMVDAFHEKTIAEANNFRTKNVQPDLTEDKNEI
jgi:hypothetical protein